MDTPPTKTAIEGAPHPYRGTLKQLSSSGTHPSSSQGQRLTIAKILAIIIILFPATFVGFGLSQNIAGFSSVLAGILGAIPMVILSLWIVLNAKSTKSVVQRAGILLGAYVLIYLFVLFFLIDWN